MNIKNRIKSAIVIAIILLVPIRTFSGWVVTGRYVNADNKTFMQRYFIQNNKIKYEQHDFIYSYDFKTDKLILINIDSLLYVKTTLSKYLEKKNADDEKILNNLAEKFLTEATTSRKLDFKVQVEIKSDRFPANDSTISIIQGNEKKSYLGHNAYNYTLYSANKVVEKIYYTDEVACFSDIDLDTFFYLQQLFNPFDKNYQIFASNKYKSFFQKGLMIRRFVSDKGRPTEFQINKYEQKLIPEYEFDIPALCKEISLEKWFDLQNNLDLKNQVNY